KNTDLLNFGDREACHVGVGHLPEIVGVVAEVFQADPHLRRVGDHVRAPVVEDLQAPHQNVRFLDVDPGVFQRATVWFGDGEAVDQQTHGDEVTIDKTVGDGANVRGDFDIERVDEIANGHGGEDVVSGEGVGGAVRIGGVDRDDSIILDMEPGNAPAEADFSSLIGHQVGDVFPKLARAV